MCEGTAVVGGGAHWLAYRKPACGSRQNVKQRLIINTDTNKKI